MCTHDFTGIKVWPVRSIFAFEGIRIVPVKFELRVLSKLSASVTVIVG
jgi:hypothetical protein